ncbi:MAG: Stp1/IreP family PP2C-type Ser/Thr phosphatase [Oscillospiraceae bacterium]|jgi:protein phosphatase|nr:Stp1/IreP family PP2C-type Ser/Thr phosphatase [Oscillospiraceae bacterium]
MVAWGKTDTGLMRKLNQDAFFIDLIGEDRAAVCVVCDGMGGAAAGEIASSLGAAAFVEGIKERIKPGLNKKELQQIAQEAAGEANREVYEKSMSDEACGGMGTTLVAVVVADENAVVLNIGDSRAYEISGGGIVKLTTDHSVVEDMIRKGDITPLEAKKHPRKNLITRAIGTDSEVQSDVYNVKVKQGSYILLCSDGLTNMVEEQEILYEVMHSPEKEAVCQRLIDLANSRGGRDNITVVLIEL